MSGLFVCSLTVEMDKLVVTVILNLPNNKRIIQPSEYEFNLIFLLGPPGDIIASTLFGKGRGIHLQDPSHGMVALIHLFIHRAQRLAGDLFGSTSSLPES